MKNADTREPGRPGRRRPRLYGLLVVNGALLLLLAAVTFTPTSTAQARVRGTYSMAGARVPGVEANVVYVVDTTNLELIAMSYDPNTKELTGVGYRNLAVDAASLQRRGSSR